MDGTTKKQTIGLHEYRDEDTEEQAVLVSKIEDLEMQCQALRDYNVELEESRERYVSIFDYSPVGHIILDTNGIVADVNLTTAMMMEMEKENMMGLPFNMFVAPYHTTMFFDHIRRCKITKTRVCTELDIKTHSRNPYCVQIISVPFLLLDHQTIRYNTTIIDISNQKRLEQEIRRLDCLNLIGEMAAGIAHEIRNPMTTVHGYLQLFLRKSSNPEEIEDFKLMLDELERANAIITEFLSLAKNKKNKLVRKNINVIVESIYPLMQAEALLAGNEIFMDLFPKLPEVLVDGKEIRQVLLNLVNNGLQAMKHGKITIRTFMEEGDIVLSVADQGHGIPDEIKRQIGTPFFTTKENGTGLGLAICYSIVQRHKAKLDYTTGEYGTTFYIRFPRQTIVK